MSSSKLIKSKIKTVGSIKKMTRAMEMIARTKMKRAIDNALSARPYTVYARELLINLTRKERFSHTLLQKGRGEETLVIVIGSDKGLCGGYNTNIVRKLTVLQNQGEFLKAITIGRRAEMMCNKLSIDIIDSYKNMSDQDIATTIFDIADRVRAEFSSGRYKDVVLLYTNFVSAMVQKVELRTIIPISIDNLEGMTKEAGAEEAIDTSRMTKNIPLYTLEPSVEEVLDAIVPQLVTAEILQGLVEARASEESMRMFAMKNATDSAGKMQDTLLVSFNKARQAAITQEIAEISAGADALNF